jgi:16S rRNA C967 or C1407 C5-methylase (RsmB/RsmF family)/NOL1/NOP2/fmu family ribosome biogenesis protein
MDRFHSAVRVRRDVAPESLPFLLRPIDWYSLGHVAVDPENRPSRTIDYAAGDFFLQDAGSMLALAGCDADAPPRTDRLVCDLCAAPGGKASALLESIGDGFLLANEPIRTRIAPLAYNLARTGIDRYAISSLDPETVADRLGGIFDLVLVDVPCSGQALMGRGKQSLSAVSESQIEHSALRARRILDSAIRLVRPGGQLVLSTCTFAEAENESQVRWMLEQDGVSPAPIQRLSKYDSGESDCTYRLWPHRHDCAGSFAASVRYDPTEQNVGGRRVKRQRRKNKERLPGELSQWFDALPKRYEIAGATIWGWPEDAPGWVDSISIRGPEIAYRTGQTWKPSHETALRRQGPLGTLQSIEVDEKTARQFLVGQPISCDRSGWCVVRHCGRGLGWVKASRGTGKNHLPTAARMTG